MSRPSRAPHQSQSNVNCNVRILVQGHCVVIVTLHVTLNKMQWANPCQSSKKLNNLNDFAPFYFFLVFLSNCHGGSTNLTSKGRHLLDTRCLFESGHQLNEPFSYKQAV